MVASLRRGALVRALTLLLALPGLAAPAFAQAPTESAWRSVGAAWVEICTAPCRVTNASSYAVRVAVGSSAPMVDDAAAAVLTSDNVMREFAVAGLKVYGRALASPTRVVVEPLGGASSGGGASTVTGSQEQDVRSTATLNAATANAAITIPINGQSTVAFTFSGLTASGATLSYEQSNDGGTTWTGVSEVNTGTGATSLTRTTDGQVRVAVQGRTNLRVRVSTAGSGTIGVAWNVSVREGLISLASPIPPGGNTIGAVLPPTAGSTQRAITKCTVAANSATLSCTTGNGTTVPSPAGVCPATSAPMATEVRSSAAAIGLGLNGQALTTATDGTAAGTPDMILPTANALYTLPVGATNSITAFNPNASAAIVTCIQTVR